MGKVDAMMKNWLGHREVLEELLKPIADEHVNFKPWDGAKSLGELALHVTQWNQTFATLVKTGECRVPEPLTMTSMSDVRAMVAELTEKTKKVYASITDAELDLTREFFSGFSASGANLLQIMYDHEVHHKGQLFVYARMVGVKSVPFFRKR